jgi:hypothetical protein
MGRNDTHSVRFADDLWEKIVKAAEKEGLPPSTWVKWIIKKALKIPHEVEK